MRVLTPADAVVDAEEVEDPAQYPKIAVIPLTHVSFAISSGTTATTGDAAAKEHWDNPECRPYGRYEISAPGACACGVRVCARVRARGASVRALTARVCVCGAHVGTYALCQGQITHLEALKTEGDEAEAPKE